MASVLVTGTSTGIGLATALTVARAGHTVHATMRNLSRGQELEEAVARERLPIRISEMDVDSDTSVQSAIAQILAEAGQIDVLVNNAGIERNGSVEELPLSDFRLVMETNYFGPLRCIKALIPGMRQRRSGCIVNVTSIAGRLTTSPLGAYAASKYALEAVSEALAQEMKMFNVRVAIVEPGIIDTRMARGIESASSDTLYPHQRRLAQMFAASLRTPVPPVVVAEKILEIIESGTLQLRHPVGPDAVPTLAWRNSLTDEEYIDLNSADDETWQKRLEERVAGQRVAAGAAQAKD